MSRSVVADVADPTMWPASAPDGSASSQLVVSGDPTGWSGVPALTIAAGAQGVGHRVERALAAAADLTGFDDLELWVRSDRVADGSAARPMYLELRLGSASAAVGAPSNPWQRLVPVAEAGRWQPVGLALDDLAPGVRAGVTSLRLTCVDATEAFSLELGAVAARRAELLLDVDAALVLRIGRGLTLDGAPVAAVVDPPAPPVPAPPFFRIRNYAVCPVEARSPSAGTRSDFTAHGFSIRPPSVPVDVYYAIEPVAADRAHAAAMFQHAFAQLAPRTTLDVAGRRVPVDWVEGPPLEFEDISAQPALHVRVATAQRPIAAPVAVVPASNIDVEVDGRAIA